LEYGRTSVEVLAWGLTLLGLLGLVVLWRRGPVAFGRPSGEENGATNEWAEDLDRELAALVETPARQAD
jgi:hypothetical protein